MPASNPLDILKSALLLEIRGKVFYTQAAASADNQAVKDFFNMMAAEEVSHVKILSAQYKNFTAEGRFATLDKEASEQKVARRVLSSDLRDQIAAAGFESAAIAAAMGMERRAVQLYSQRAGEAEDPQEKALYEWLARWETEHLEFLARIDKEVTEAIWNDNSFWPF